MEKEKKNNKKYLKSIILTLIPIIIAIVIILMGSMYYIFKDDINELSKAQKEYYNSLEVTPNGIQKVSRSQKTQPLQTVVLASNTNRYNNHMIRQEISSLNYNWNFAKIASADRIILGEAEIIESEKNAKLLAEEIAAEIDCLEKYIDDSKLETKEEKLAYLMNAEIVTRFPYIDDIDGDETKLNGIIKFYRYLSLIENEEDLTDVTDSEPIELTFVDTDEFERKLVDYENSGNKEVFNHFTFDEDKNVIIAYGTATTKTITTTDNEVTLDTINENATVTYSKKEDGVYLYKEYTVSKKKIDYQSLTEQYVLPFNLLATLLVQTRDYRLVKEIADLAYDSEIVIGIFDNKTITENTDEYTYNKKIKYTQNTELVFDNIDTDPQVNISSSRYSEVVKECLGKLNDKRDNSIHCSGIDQEDLETATGNRSDGNVYEAYVSKISEDGTISEITTDAHEFKTTFNVKTVSNSAPTVDISIADIWAGKYISTYIPEKDEKPPEPASTYSLDDEEFVNIELNKFEEELLKEDGAIGKKLKAHSDNLRKLAIEKIIAKTDFTVTPRAMTENDILAHADTCEECTEELTSKYGVFWTIEIESNENIINEVKTLEELETVQVHIEEMLQNEAKEKTEKRKEKFIKDINSEGQITYKQWPTSYKANVSILDSSTSLKISSTYKKDSSEMEDSGEKFSKIFNQEKFKETKEAILAREGWFWESIRENEDTAKLEDLIRYIFNIAFNTEHFGTFASEEVDKLFEIFQTQGMKTTTKIYGNTIEEKVWFALINAGYTKEAAAGVMGNIYQESRFDPSLVEKGTEIGFGLCQWSYGRRTQMEAYAESKGVEPSDIDTQIEFLLTEMTPGATGPAQGYADVQFYKKKVKGKEYTREDWINAETPEDAAAAFCWSFERPNEDKAMLDVRQQKAREYFEKYYDFEEMGGIFQKDTSGDKKIIGTFTSSITGRTFTIIKQSQIKNWDANNNGKKDDYDWDSGCNRAAQVSICSGYWSKSIDELIIEIAKAGSGVAPCYQKTYNECGLSYSNQELTGTWTFDENKIREQVQNGGYIALYLRGSWMGESGYSKTDPDTKWANRAHWIAILGYREIDGKEEIFVSDSAGRGNSGWWPINEFDGIINNVVFVNEKK